MAVNAKHIDAVSRVYAQALLELAESQGELSGTGEEMADLAALLQDNADLRRLIESPILDRKQRGGLVERLFQGKVSDLLYKFIRVVNQKDRLASLPGIAAAFAVLLAEKNNQLDVDAYVASPLDDATAHRVAEGLGRSLGKQITLTQHVDPALIGGLKLRIGDRLVDASVATQLKNIERKLVAAGREKARAVAAAESN